MHEPVTEGGRPQGQIERTVIKMGLGLVQGMQGREEALRSTRPGEYEQQVQVSVTGKVETSWVFVDIPVSWEHPFLYAPLQRDIPFETPQVFSHIEFVGTLADLVVAHAHVISWNQNDMGWLIGATARFAASAPNASSFVSFAAVLHLTFQAYAFPTDEELNT